MKTKWFIGAASAAVLLFAGACGGSDEKADDDDGGGGGGGDAKEGQELFNGTCATCHGTDAKEPPVGKDLRASQFVADTGNADLVAFVQKGRPSSDPANTTGVDMPAKGGNPSLSEEDLQSIVAYLKSINS